MDLKLEDVATLLNVSEETVQRWIRESKIPHYRLHQQYRFSRSEIEDWVLGYKQSREDWKVETPREPLGLNHFSLYRAIHKGGVYAEVPGSTKEEVIRTAMQRIALDLNLDAEVITELLLDREQLMPTALSNGIAVPHTRDFLLKGAFDVVSVVFPQEPIEYGALDGQPVDVLFFLFACNGKRHLHLLAKLAHLSRSAENLAFLKGAPAKPELLEFVRQWESHLSIGPLALR